MNDRVAGADVDVEHVERDDALVLEIFLDFHFHVIAREVVANLVAIGAELVGNARDENLDGHDSPTAVVKTTMAVVHNYHSFADICPRNSRACKIFRQSP
jgi:hypothetical protein